MDGGEPSGAYELFQNGTRLLEDGDFHAATVPLARARDLEPEKTSIREALGRALFGSRRYREAAEEFGEIVERMGRHAEARRPLALAANLRPDRSDYRQYRDHSRRRAA
jgi:thioredoxin-like negative regulator of GroEL